MGILDQLFFRHHRINTAWKARCETQRSDVGEY